MYTTYYYPFQQPWIAANLPFLNLENATWQNQWFALVQQLTPEQFGQVSNAVQEGRVLGIKPGSHPAGNPIGK